MPVSLPCSQTKCNMLAHIEHRDVGTNTTFIPSVILGECQHQLT